MASGGLRIFLIFAFIWVTVATNSHARQAQGSLIVEVRSDSGPVEQAEVSAGGQFVLTDARGEAKLELPSGDVELTIGRYGFTSRTVQASVPAGATTRVTVQVEPESVLKQEITVTATRTETRIEDQPLRVEVLDQEEVEEKTLMTPGDIAMLLNEDRRDDVGVIESGYVARPVKIRLERGTDSPCMLTARAAHGRFDEGRPVPVTLNDVAELMAVVLCHESSADRDHSLSQKETAGDPGIKPVCLEFLREPFIIEAAGCHRCASRGHRRIADRASPALFNRCARGDK